MQFRPLKPVLFFQVMPLGTRSVRHYGGQTDYHAGGVEAEEMCFTASAAEAECTYLETHSILVADRR